MNMNSTYQPVLIPAHSPELEETLRTWNIQERFDNLDEQIEELYQVIHPVESRQKDQEHFQEFVRSHFGENKGSAGVWVVYPWLYRAIRVAPEEQFIALRTARNQNIITKEEQQRFLQGVVGIAGLSVGSSIANILALTGGGKMVKIADFDTLAITNLNRINNSVASLGLNKAVICARRIYEINPFAQVELFTDGITEENIAEFLGGEHPLDVLFDEIDNLKIKIDLRLHARDRKLPVVMITDNGDNIMIDIERYDQGVTTLFHGRLEEEEAKALFATQSLDPKVRAQMTLKIIGAENGVPRMQDSLLEVGRTLPSWPQLGTATTLTGAAGAYIARKIILREPLFSGRTHLSLDATLIPEYMSEALLEERRQGTENFVRKLQER